MSDRSFFTNFRKRKSLFYASAAGVTLMLAVFSLAFSFPSIAARIIWQSTHNFSATFFLRPADAALLFKIGNYYFNGGAYDLAKAQQGFEEAIKADKNYLGPHYQLARIYFLKADYKTAQSLINEEIRLQPDLKRSYYIRGLINAYSGNLEEAARDFLVFLEFDPQSWAAHNDLAFVYWKLGDYQKMKETAQKGLALNPGNAWLSLTLENALFNLGRYQEALNVLESAESAIKSLSREAWQKAYPGHNPKDAFLGAAQMQGVYYFNQGLLYEKLDRRQEAADAFEQWLALNEKNSDDFEKNSVKDKIASLRKQ